MKHIIIYKFFLCWIFSFNIFHIASANHGSSFCRPAVIYKSINGDAIPTLGEENKKLKDLAGKLAHTSNDYCGTTVTIDVKKGIQNLKLADDPITRDKTKPYLRVEYISPKYTLEVRNQNNIIKHKLVYGGKKNYTVIIFKNKNAEPEEVYKFWDSQKRFVLEKLENEFNQYKEAKYFFKTLIEKYMGEPIPKPNFVESSKETIKSTFPDPNYNPLYSKIPEDSKGFLINFENNTIPIQVQKGDELTFIAKGKIAIGRDYFYPHGMHESLRRRYEPKRSDQRYAKLLLGIGDKVYAVGKGATFTVEEPGEVKLFPNMRVKEPKEKGSFEVWVYHNQELISPKSNTGYISVLKEASFNDNFYFSPDHQLIAGVDNKAGCLKVWDTQKGILRKQYDFVSSSIIALSFMEYDPVMVTVGQDGKIKFREVVSGKILTTLFLDKIEISKADFDRKNKTLAAIPYQPMNKYSFKNEVGKTIVIYDLEKELLQEGKDTRQILSEHKEIVTAIGFSPFEDIFLSGDASGRILIWDTNTWKVRQEIQIKKQSISDFFFDQKTSTVWVKALSTSYADPSTGGVTEITNEHHHRYSLKNGSVLTINSDDFDKANDFPDTKVGEYLLGKSKNRTYMIFSNRDAEIQVWETKNY